MEWLSNMAIKFLIKVKILNVQLFLLQRCCVFFLLFLQNNFYCYNEIIIMFTALMNITFKEDRNLRF